MNRRDEREGDDSRRLLSGLDSAPVPEGMARRAVDRWAGERRGARPSLLVLATWPRLAFAAALFVLVFLVHAHLGRDPLPTNRSQTARLAPVPSPAPRPTKSRSRPAPPAPRIHMVRRSPPPPALDVRPGPRPKATTPAGAEPVTIATPVVLVGSAADMAYLNRDAPVEERAEAGVTVLADLRLGTPVSLVQPGEDLADLMGALRGRTGVDIVLPDDLARTRLALLCKERPLRDVLREMGRSMGVRWRRSGVGYASRYAAEPGPDTPVWSEEAPAPDAGRRDLQQLAAVTGLDVIGDPNQVRAALEGTARPAPVEGWLVLSGGR